MLLRKPAGRLSNTAHWTGFRLNSLNMSVDICRLLPIPCSTSPLTEPCLYYSVEAGELVLLLLYVDDILLAATTRGIRDKYYELISAEYTVKSKPTLDRY